MNDSLGVSLPVGGQVARRGNLVSLGIARLMLKAMGWRITGAIPDLPKMVLIGAPHTSNMDGVIAIAVLSALGLRSGTMIKDSAFKGVMGPVLRWFGAIPVNRTSPKGIVGQSIDAFDNAEKLLLLIAPEGTRTAAPAWKRGFYLIASGAKAPILPAAIDYQKKIVTFGPPVTPSGNYAADMRTLLAFYGAHSSPRHPDRASDPICGVLGLTFKPVLKVKDAAE